MRNTENGAAILREAAYEIGYQNGVTCGKLCASQQILDDLEELLTKKKEEFKQKANEHPEIDYPEADAFWTGRSVSCHDLLLHIKNLKKKYEVL